MLLLLKNRKLSTRLLWMEPFLTLLVTRCVCVTVHYTAQILIPLSSHCIILFYCEIVINMWLLRPGTGLRLGCGSAVFKACFQRSKLKRKKVKICCTLP